MKVIAKKSTFMVGIRIITLIIITIYILYESSSIVFLILKYVFIAYGFYQLSLLFMQLFQPKELINLENQKIYINKLFKTIEIDVNLIEDINYKTSNNRGTLQSFGTIYIITKNKDKIKIINVEKIEEATKNLIKLINNKKFKTNKLWLD